MKIKEVNYYGFAHKKVYKQFGGDLTYIRTFSIWGKYDWVPVAVYRAANPDRSKGHKEYMLLMTNPEGGGTVSGMEQADIDKYRTQKGIICLNCDNVLYSINRHHLHHCGCKNEAMIDGGRNYLRCGAKDITKIREVTIDLLTGEVLLDEDK